MAPRRPAAPRARRAAPPRARAGSGSTAGSADDAADVVEELAPDLPTQDEADAAAAAAIDESNADEAFNELLDEIEGDSE